MKSISVVLCSALLVSGSGCVSPKGGRDKRGADLEAVPLDCKSCTDETLKAHIVQQFRPALVLTVSPEFSGEPKIEHAEVVQVPIGGDTLPDRAVWAIARLSFRCQWSFNPECVDPLAHEVPVLRPAPLVNELGEEEPTSAIVVVPFTGPARGLKLTSPDRKETFGNVDVTSLITSFCGPLPIPWCREADARF